MTTYADTMSRAHRVTSKYRHYGPMYDMVLATLPPAPTVLEIGIANGGSLETWRALLGPEARIIGVDLNPRATSLRADGFEVYVLDTALPASWESLRSDLAGSVDLLVDDGGHTNRQQVTAVVEGLALVRDGGWIVVEDLHCSFMAEFGNPNPYSAVRFLDEVTDDLHRCHPRSDMAPKHPNLARSIDYTVTATSWAALRVRRWDPASREEVTAGTDASLMDHDHRFDSQATARRLGSWLPRPVARVARSLGLRAWETLTMRSAFRRDARSPVAARSE